jgi:hypothetical protein
MRQNRKLYISFSVVSKVYTVGHDNSMWERISPLITNERQKWVFILLWHSMSTGSRLLTASMRCFRSGTILWNFFSFLWDYYWIKLTGYMFGSTMSLIEIKLFYHTPLSSKHYTKREINAVAHALATIRFRVFMASPILLFQVMQLKLFIIQN